MTEVPDLLGAVDFTKFKTKDESWFLGAAGDTIRDYCGWHISPVQATMNVQARIGHAGLVMLPSLNVESVESVRSNGVALPVESYVVHSAGWIELVGWYPTGETGFVPLWASQPPLRANRDRWLTVDFTHGFANLPKTVAEVGFELTARTLEKPAGVAKSLQAGPNSFQFNEFGMVLSDDQKARLTPYCVQDWS